MNINDLTIGQAKELSMLFTKDGGCSGSLNAMVGKKVIIRTYSAGVHYGELVEKSGNEVILKNARRMNYFKTIKGISLSSVANNGVHADSRIAEPLANILWLEAIEILICSPDASKSIEGHSHE